MKYCCIFCTAPDLKKARTLAGLLLSRKLAACVQLVPGLESHYRWQGKKETSKEILLLIKTKVAAYKKIEKILLQNHSYEVPEIICLPVIRGSKSYLDWINKSISLHSISKKYYSA